MSDTDASRLDIWTLYDHPRDMPDCYVLRRFEVGRDGWVGPTSDVRTSKDIESLREIMRSMGLSRIERSEGDEPQIVESWL